MTREEIINQVADDYANDSNNIAELHDGLRPEFSCHMCKTELKITTCERCPLYCQNYSKD